MQKKLPKMTAEAMDAASAEDIVPRLRSKSWLAAVRKQVPEEQLPMHEPLAGEVLVTYAFDLPEHFVLVSPPRLQRLGLAAHDLRATAVQNMKSRLGKVAVRDLDLFYAVEVQNDLEACVVLLDNFWAQVEGGMIEGDIIAATPCRNGLLFCSADSEEGVEGLHAFIETTFESHERGDPNYLISQQLLRRSGGKWRVEE